MKYIALVDNYPIVRVGISLFFKENHADEFYVQAADDINCPALAAMKSSPDVIMLALNDHDLKRFAHQMSVCRSRYAGSKIMVYGDHFSYEDLTKLIALGVSGFVLKSSDISQVVTCIQEIMHQDHFFCSELIGLILSNLTSSKKTGDIALEARLSAREEEIANYLIKGMKTSDIAERLGRKATTISSIKNNLFRKMNVNNVMALNEAMSRMRM